MLLTKKVKKRLVAKHNFEDLRMTVNDKIMGWGYLHDLQDRASVNTAYSN